jgi:hypothetical protein
MPAGTRNGRWLEIRPKPAQSVEIRPKAAQSDRSQFNPTEADPGLSSAKPRMPWVALKAAFIFQHF